MAVILKTINVYNAGVQHIGFSTTRARHRVHQAQSAVGCSTNRMKGELHPTKDHLGGGLLHLVRTFLHREGRVHRHSRSYIRPKNDAHNRFSTKRRELLTAVCSGKKTTKVG